MKYLPVCSGDAGWLSGDAGELSGGDEGGISGEAGEYSFLELFKHSDSDDELHPEVILSTACL